MAPGALVALAACGGSHRNPGTDDASPTPDGPSDPLVDAAVDAPGGTPADAPPDACSFGAWTLQDTTQTFREVNRSSDTDFGVEISRDGLRVVFASDRSDAEQQADSFDLYMARRSSTTVPFDKPVHLPMSTTGDDFDPTMSDDELELYFVADLGPFPCIYVSRRATPTASWGTPRRLDALCPTGLSFVEGPFLNKQADRLYFNVITLTAGTMVMVATRDGRNLDFTSAAPAGAPGLRFVALDNDEVTLYGENGTGGNAQIWEATRPRIGAPFSAAHAIPELADAFDTGDPSITADGTHLAYASSHVGTLNAPSQLYIAERRCQ